MLRILPFFMIAFLVSYNVYCGTPIDSLKARLKQIEQVSQKQTDSLQRELQFYKIKEDFYSDKFSALGSMYSTVMAIIAALFTIAGTTFFLYKIKEVRITIENKIIGLEETQKSLFVSQKATYGHFLTTQGNVSLEKLKRYINRESWIRAIDECISGIFFLCTAHELGEEVLSKESLDKTVAYIIKKASLAVTNLQLKDGLSTDNDKKELTKLLRYLADSTLDDSIVHNTSLDTRQLYYNFRQGLMMLIRTLNKS